MNNQQNPSSSSSTKIDRKTIEKNRRDHMKSLYSELNSLLPHPNSREAMSLPNKLDQVATYIKKLQVSIERMKEKKNSLAMDRVCDRGNSSSDGSGGSSNAPVKSSVEIHEMGGSALQVVLTTGPNCQSVFKETARILLEEGADIVNASFSVVDQHTVHHIIHCEIGGFIYPSPEASRISRRLRKFVDEEC